MHLGSDRRRKPQMSGDPYPRGRAAPHAQRRLKSACRRGWTSVAAPGSGQQSGRPCLARTSVACSRERLVAPATRRADWLQRSHSADATPAGELGRLSGTCVSGRSRSRRTCESPPTKARQISPIPFAPRNRPRLGGLGDCPPSLQRPLSGPSGARSTPAAPSPTRLARAPSPAVDDPPMRAAVASAPSSPRSGRERGKRARVPVARRPSVQSQARRAPPPRAHTAARPVRVDRTSAVPTLSLAPAPSTCRRARGRPSSGADRAKLSRCRPLSGDGRRAPACQAGRGLREPGRRGAGTEGVIGPPTPAVRFCRGGTPPSATHVPPTRQRRR